MFLKKLNKIASNQSGVRASVMYGNILDQERYFKTLPYVKNKDILDCACGIGWGSYLIACVGDNHVTAVDLSKEAITAAKNYFNHPNIDFINGDIDEIKIGKKFDIICSFETIEHVQDPEKFLKILFNCAKEDCIFFLSTPNGNVFKSNKIPENPYHVDEYSRNEVEQFIKQSGWKIENYLGQYTIDPKNIYALNEYKNFIKNFWVEKKLSSRYGYIYKIPGKIFRRLFNKKIIDPAHRSSCKPVEISVGYEPAYHYYILRK